MKKFSHTTQTADGAARAWVAPVQLETLWINTGTLCNLTCKNCYIESSPHNDRLVYITTNELRTYLDEIKTESYGTKEIGFTGGEPFLNPDMLEMIKECLERGFETLILSNAMKPMQNHFEELLALKEKYPQHLKIRVSLDHYKEEMHAKERGPKAWKPALKGLKDLSLHNFSISVAGRTAWEETEDSMRLGYHQLFMKENINLDASNPNLLVLFPEMDVNVDVPEITTKCWDTLNISPKSIMCATSRMVVKRKGESHPKVLACTLLPYDREFEMGSTLKESLRRIYLNHVHCAKFCVLGGASCSVQETP